MYKYGTRGYNVGNHCSVHSDDDGLRLRLFISTACSDVTCASGARPSMSGTGAWSWLAVDASCSFVVRWDCDCTTRLRASPPATHSISISGICLSITRSHGCPHVGANGISWPPWKIDEKLKSENMQKKSSFLYVYVKILRAIRAGRCRERRYADHIFIQIYFRKHHFVVKFS